MAGIKFMYSRGQIMHWDLDLKILCHKDRLISGKYRTLDDMSPDGIWDYNEEAIDHRNYGG